MGKNKIFPRLKEEMGMTEWIYVNHYEHCGVGFDEYVSADGTLVKQIWFDGYEEIFEKG